MRAGHPLAGGLDLDRYCAAEHLVMSARGDPQANVDLALDALGRGRRVALTAPNMMLGLSLAAQSDLLIAAPRALVATHAARFGLAFHDPPFPLERFVVSATAARAAMADAGVAWLMDTLDAAFAT